MDEDQPLTFGRSVVEMGLLLQEEEVRPPLELVNRGTNNVLITGVSSTCGCTVVPESFLGKVIPAGGHVAVPLSYHAGRADGPVSARVQVIGEREGRRETAWVQLRGEVVAELTVEPKVVDFGVLSPGEERTRLVAIRPKACTNLVVRSARSNRLGFEVMLGETTASASNDATSLTVKCKSPLTSGRQSISGEVILETSSKRTPVVRIPVLAQVWPQVAVAPPALVLAGAGLAGESRVTLETRTPSRILRIRAHTPGGVADLLGHGAWVDDSDKWGQLHFCHVRNEALDQARQLTFELMVRHDTDRTEAQSVSVDIKRLAKLDR